MKITDLEDLPSVSKDVSDLFSVLPFDESEDDHQHFTMSIQNGGLGREGVINAGCDEYLTSFTENNVCEHRDSQLNGQAECFEEIPKDDLNTAPQYKSLMPFCLVVGLGTLFSQSVSVYLSSQITVLERAFGLSSSTSGLLLSANDIGFVATVLFASHFLKRCHIPRVIALCIFAFGVAGLATSLPHFIIDEQEHGDVTTLANSSSSQEHVLCVHSNTDNKSMTNKCQDHRSHVSQAEEGYSSLVVAIIAISMLVQGVAKAPRTPLCSLYVDNNSEKEKTGFYIGTLMSFSIFGPFIAITAGGLFNKLPVDLTETSLTPDDPRWIGAWWLGFIVFGACSVLICIPIFFFPASLRMGDENKNDKATEYVNSSVAEAPPSFTSNLKDMPRSVFRVLRKPVFICNLFSALFVVFAFMALGSFGPKYIENQFQIPTWKANVVLGLEKLVTTVTGTFIGGLVTKRLRLGLFGCVKMLLVSRSVAFACQLFNFLWGCDNPVMVGFDHSEKISNLTCECSGTDYLPVCGDGRTFFSPCFAGCSAEINGVYTNCSAVSSGEVQTGFCDPGCAYFVPFIVLNALSSLIGTMTIAPSYVTILRSVDDKDRGMAVGIQSFMLALLVFLPAPIVYGGVFDSLCLVWKGTCSGKGSCSLYNVRDMRFRLIAVNVGLFAIGLILTCGTCVLARRREAADKRRLEKTREIKPPVPQPRVSLSDQKQ